MTIGELAKRVGVAPSKLRFLEDAGLIRSVRLPNGYRSYSETTVSQTKDILQAQSFGFTLAEISAGFIESGGKKLRCDLAIKAMESKLLDLEQHIERVQLLRIRILSSIEELQARKSAV
jgi:DNA-binding transcriptional MerR regulator